MDHNIVRKTKKKRLKKMEIIIFFPLHPGGSAMYSLWGRPLFRDH